MGFTRKESSSEPLKRVSATCPNKKISPGNRNNNNQPCGLGSKKSISLRLDALKHGKNAAAIFPESNSNYDVEENFDFERWSSENDCMWLSSDIMSPTWSFENNESWDVSLDERFFSWFMIARSSGLFSYKGMVDGSSIDPIEEASLVLETMSNGMVMHKDLKEEQVLTWLLNSSRNDIKESSITCRKSKWDIFQSDFPSPSYNIKWNSVYKCDNTSYDLPPEAVSDLDDFDTNGPLFWPSNCKFSWGGDRSWELFCISPRKNVSENVEDLANFDTNGPLFWPSHCKCSWSNEVAFSISPRKNIRGIGTSERFWAAKSVILRLHERRKDRKGKTSGLIDGKKVVRRISTMPSRLSKSSGDSMEKIPYGTTKEPPKGGTHTGAVIVDDRELLEEEFRSNYEVPIETLVGLNEFDGHEGVDAEFTEDKFTMDEPLIEDIEWCK